MPLGKPLVHRRRQEEPGVAVEVAKVAHGDGSGTVANQCHELSPLPPLGVKSDRLLEVSMPEVAALVAAADSEIANLLSPADILIIQDEPLTAFDLEDLVEGLGHHVIGIARTHEQALTLAQSRQPVLILSDIQLADGSTGIDAVNALLRNFDAPVIFVTGHAELLLSGKKPEPTFLIPKPYNPEMVRAIIGQALFFEVRSHIEPTAGEEAGVHAPSSEPTGTTNLPRC